MANLISLKLARPEFTLQINLKLPSEGITSIYGASGSGKTSLLRCVAGLEKAMQAHIEVGGECWQDDATGIFIPTWKRPIGYVFQEASLFAHLNVQQNLEFGLKRMPSDKAKNSLKKAIDLLELGPLLKRRTQSLSGGERQRIAIARALATAARLMLLDEPLASLDIPRRLEILPWLETLRDELNIPMLYVTHAIEEVMRLADNVIVLEQGRVSDYGSTDEVLSKLNPLYLPARTKVSNQLSNAERNA